MYTIGQVSEMYNLPISTLRYYDKEGFFPNLMRKGNIRYFSDDELEAIRVIECLKRSGLEIKDIKQFFQWVMEGPSSYGKRKEMFETRKAAVEDEIKALERSFALNHAMLRWLEESQLQPGRSEAELAWAIEKYFRDNGASELAFPSIVAVDQNAALPHAIPGEKKLPDNGLVLVDVGCRVDGYCSDQTRTFWVGDAPHKEFRETMKLVRDAQQAALDKMRPGLPLHEAYTLARGVFEKAGVEAWFTHGLGHGVGLETHEAPSLGRRGDKVLQEGMVVTVEPGLYYPQWGGIRWEYTVLITADGNRIL